MKLRLSSTAYIALIALFFTLIQNIGLWHHLSDLFSKEPPHSWIFVATIPLFIFFALNIIFTLLIWPVAHRIFIPIIIILSSLATYGMYTYGTFFDYGMIVNIFETNTGEATSYLSWGLVPWFLIICVLPIVVLSLTKVMFKPFWKELLSKLISIVVSVVVIAVIAGFYYKDYASLVRNHSEIKALLNPTNYITATYRYGRYQLVEAHMPFKHLGEDAVDTNKSGRPNVVVMVLGEASRSMNYSLNGYKRDTNPQLSQRDVISFKNVQSCGTATAVSVPCMFSDMTRATYKPTTVRHQDSVMDVLNHAGINLLWKDNDGGCKGVCDRIKHIEMTAKIDPSLCHNDSCYDQILLNKLQQFIDEQKQDTLIVIHLIGSHGPTYDDRYPAKFKHFTPTCDTSDLQNCTREQVTNTYDNSILYTDHILSQVVDILKADDKHANTAMVYMADHGESLGEDGIYLHGLPYSIAPKEQTTVPLILWLSPSYEKSQKINRQCLIKESNQGGITQDNLFHTLLGMMDVKTKIYQPKLDIFNQCR
ncbi:phosphoethanolamine transferase EptA [Photobacterium damselae]|uniref:Phosphoethanolamine transferase EptA n=1 Tax=Photobacterium damselae TaxID=38293 RepID=A0ACD3T0Z1_PHODM|nr:phosphoethanolamine transferase EptA [Photobacterium damselae]RDL29544.1 phosphoethanolamine transferase EptA [Photobacterium damselae]TMX54159.1 phosphoethanolamine transferase EptA [Photobacterium damselae]TMX69887.1 phosphoethanolamine transferase EptA [Photobacterium damselae]TMX77744.1 phosphoethanolamine transferase EptA [Photobacterium damselae]